MYGECYGRRIQNESDQVDQIKAFYSPVGITGVTIRIEGREESFGNVSHTDAQITDWTFNDENEFKGFQVWQT